MGEKEEQIIYEKIKNFFNPNRIQTTSIIRLE